MRAAIATVFDGYATAGGYPPRHRRGSSAAARSSWPTPRRPRELLGAVHAVDGLDRVTAVAGVPPQASEPLRAAAADFVLEGLCALKKISRTDEGRLQAVPARGRAAARTRVRSKS